MSKAVRGCVLHGVGPWTTATGVHPLHRSLPLLQALAPSTIAFTVAQQLLRGSDRRRHWPAEGWPVRFDADSSACCSHRPLLPTAREHSSCATVKQPAEPGQVRLGRTRAHVQSHSPLQRRRGGLVQRDAPVLAPALAARKAEDTGASSSQPSRERQWQQMMMVCLPSQNSLSYSTRGCAPT